MYKKLSILLATLWLLSACASNMDEAKRLEDCVLNGNVNGNCEISTIEYGG